MSIHNQRSGVYIVRIWWETSHGEGVWRASALDTVSKERMYFASRRALLAFLFPEDDGLPDGKGDELGPCPAGDTTP